ncbi:MAG: hypothetical protein ACNA8W_04430, partial [Bradymonadaceae bacterium]
MSRRLEREAAGESEEAAGGHHRGSVAQVPDQQIPTQAQRERKIAKTQHGQIQALEAGLRGHRRREPPGRQTHARIEPELPRPTHFRRRLCVARESEPDWVRLFYYDASNLYEQASWGAG